VKAFSVRRSSHLKQTQTLEDLEKLLSQSAAPIAIQVEALVRRERTVSEFTSSRRGACANADGDYADHGNPRLGLGKPNLLGSSAPRGTPRAGTAPTILAQPAEPELPMTVKDAARFLGVSPQTVYLWVERKQIPHLRVMGRNIRFLESDLRSFREQFKQEVVEWQDQ
jgi:excisionase family DNA binding protein